MMRLQPLPAAASCSRFLQPLPRLLPQLMPPPPPLLLLLCSICLIVLGAAKVVVNAVRLIGVIVFAAVHSGVDVCVDRCGLRASEQL